VFTEACRQGIYERLVVELICKLVRPHSVYFDIGANIGLMAIPPLRACPTATVVSLEPSPSTLPYLTRTASESKYAARWRVMPCAVGSAEHEQEFMLCGPEFSAYEGFTDTHRASVISKTRVKVTTLDRIWDDLQRPDISVIKIDVEGAENEVFKGMGCCLERTRPPIVCEWNRLNLAANHCPVESILEFCKEVNYRLFSIPNLIPVECQVALQTQMLLTENFLLVPNSDS
jgi:FkbM family methyltransferase